MTPDRDTPRKTYLQTVIHFPDRKVYTRVRAAAKRAGISASAFMRLAVEAALVRHEAARMRHGRLANGSAHP